MKPGSNMQLSKKSLAEELAGRLQDQFMSGKFEVGEKLPPEPELMQIFGVGRSTVREAVRILSNMGFLKVRQGAGTFVERLTPPDEPMERRLGRADLHDLDEVRENTGSRDCRKSRRTANGTRRRSPRKAPRGTGSDRGFRGIAGLYRSRRQLPHRPGRGHAQRNPVRAVSLDGRPSEKEVQQYIQEHGVPARLPATHGQLLGYILAGDVRNAREASTRILEEP